LGGKIEWRGRRNIGRREGGEKCGNWEEKVIRNETRTEKREEGKRRTYGKKRRMKKFGNEDDKE
jgi:hypothetical protein